MYAIRSYYAAGRGTPEGSHWAILNNVIRDVNFGYGLGPIYNPHNVLVDGNVVSNAHLSGCGMADRGR